MASLNYQLFQFKCPMLSSTADIKARLPLYFSNRISGDKICVYEKGHLYARDQPTVLICNTLEIEVPDKEKSYLIHVDTKEILYCFEENKAYFKTYSKVSARTKEEDKALGYILAVDKNLKPCIVSFYAGLPYLAEFMNWSTVFMGVDVHDCGNALAKELYMKIENKWHEPYMGKDIFAVPFGNVFPKGLKTDIMSKLVRKTFPKEKNELYVADVVNVSGQITCEPEVQVIDDMLCLPLDTKMFVNKNGVRIETRNFIATKELLEDILGFSNFQYVLIGG